MRKFLLILIPIGALLGLSGVASANNSINHTGCHHGNSEKPCKPDPNPDHGHDCDNKSGGNQDHCHSTTTTTQPPTTTTTEHESTTTTTEPSETTTTTAPIITTTTTSAPTTTTTGQPVTTTTALPGVTTTTTTAPPAVTILPPTTIEGTHCTDATGHSFVTSLDVCPPVATAPVTPAAPTGPLPHTGANTKLLLMLGLGLGLAGMSIRKFATR